MEFLLLRDLVVLGGVSVHFVFGTINIISCEILQVLRLINKSTIIYNKIIAVVFSGEMN